MSPPARPKIYSITWQIAVVLAFNAVVAGVLTLLSGRLNWVGYELMFVYSQSIGFSILTASHLSARLRGHAEEPTPGDIGIGIVLGTVAGSLLGALLTGTLDTAYEGSGLVATLVIGLAFGAVAGHFFYSNYRIAQARQELTEQANRQLAAEKALAETELRLLQAQIEPHFLFNTLSNIHSLIEVAPQQAGAMLAALSDYLRGSLKRTREGVTTLGDELALIEAYITIQKMRMGERLRFRLEVEPAFNAIPFPPMLLQPLVENAVLHGVEPRVDGGEVAVSARRTDGLLLVEVADNGDGSGAAGNGIALANVRERLAGLYGEAAGLELTAREPHGVCARLWLPLEQTA